MSGQGLESTCQAENKSLPGLTVFIYVYARGVCKLLFNPLKIYFILRPNIIGLVRSERVLNFWG